MTDYEMIKIVPALHRNVINFMGMDVRSKYICSKKIKNFFVALDNKNVLTTWNILTGKVVHKNTADVDLTGYEMYQYEDIDVTYKREWCQPKCLLREIKAVEGYSDEKFYDPEFLKATFEGNKPYTRILGKTFHRYKMIEIMSEREVKVLTSFVHVFYGKGKY